MSVAEKLVGFFLVPAAGAPQRVEGGTGSQLSPPVAIPTREETTGPAGAPVAAAEGGADAPGPSEIPRAPARVVALRRDGAAARQLAPAPEPEHRPALRLVPTGAPAAPEPIETSGTEPSQVGPSAPDPTSSAGVSPGGAPSAAEPQAARRAEGTAPRICVLGDGRAAAFLASALANRLSRDPAARCAVLCRSASVAPSSSPAGRRWSRSAARRVARRLSDNGLAVEARGRLVELTLPAHADASARVAWLTGSVSELPVVIALPATRAAELDPLLVGHDLVLLAVGAATPEVLTDLALSGLEQAAPGAVVRSVVLPTRFGPGARRAAVHAALEPLR